MTTSAKALNPTEAEARCKQVSSRLNQLADALRTNSRMEEKVRGQTDSDPETQAMRARVVEMLKSMPFSIEEEYQGVLADSLRLEGIHRTHYDTKTPVLNQERRETDTLSKKGNLR